MIVESKKNERLSAAIKQSTLFESNLCSCDGMIFIGDDGDDGDDDDK